MNEQPTLNQLANLVGGTLYGEAALTVTGAAPLDEVSAGEITFIDQSERAGQASASAASAVVVPVGVKCADKPYLQVADVHAAFKQIVSLFRPQYRRTCGGIATSAVVNSSARIAPRVTIGSAATIDAKVSIGRGTVIHAGVHVMSGCEIGQNVTLFPGVVLYENTKVGDNSIIHAGAIVGAYGFGYRQNAGCHELSAQLGNVEIGQNVEIGANATIDRGTYSATRIGDGTKIDNLVQVAHNCQIGKHNLLCAQVGIAGSTTTGDYVVMAGQVGVRDHVTIGEGARIGAMAGVSNDIAPGVVAFGAPATPERDQKILLASLAKLPELRKQFKQLQKAVRQLEQLEQNSQNERADLDSAA